MHRETTLLRCGTVTLFGHDSVGEEEVFFKVVGCILSSPCFVFSVRGPWWLFAGFATLGLTQGMFFLVVVLDVGAVRWALFVQAYSLESDRTSDVADINDQVFDWHTEFEVRVCLCVCAPADVCSTQLMIVVRLMCLGGSCLKIASVSSGAPICGGWGGSRSAHQDLAPITCVSLCCWKIFEEYGVHNK